MKPGSGLHVSAPTATRKRDGSINSIVALNARTKTGNRKRENFSQTLHSEGETIFLRKYVAGEIHAPVPVYKDVSMNDANWNSQLKSTYGSRQVGPCDLQTFGALVC